MCGITRKTCYLKRTCQRCSKGRVSKLEAENLALRAELTIINKELKERKDLEILKIYESNCGLGKENEELEKRNSSLKAELQDLEAENSNLKSEKILLQKRASRLKMDCQKLREEKGKVDHEALEAIIAGKSPDPIITREAKCNRLSDSMRITMMGLQEAGVAASKCPAVVGIVSQHLFGQDLDLPSASTALNMGDEAHVLATLQAAQVIMESENATLHTDGTSRQKRQYIGQQVTLADGSLINLGFSEVATEDSDILLSTTLNLFEELSDLYCQITEQERGDIFKRLLEAVTSLMSDRAAVMQCYNKKFDPYRRTALKT